VDLVTDFSKSESKSKSSKNGLKSGLESKSGIIEYYKSAVTHGIVHTHYTVVCVHASGEVDIVGPLL